MSPSKVSAESGTIRCLAEPGRDYALYVHHGGVVKDGKPRYQVDAARRRNNVSIDLPAGSWHARWIDTKTGRTAARERFRHSGGVRRIQSPEYSADIALLIGR